MDRTVIDLTIEEAGSLIYIADRKFGGLPPAKFHEFFGGADGLKELTRSGAVMAGSLYQDDGYNVRIVFGELDQPEADEWTSRIHGTIETGGTVVLSGVCDQDLEKYMASWTVAEPGGSYELGTFIEMPAGRYNVNVFAYPPGDLAGGWMAIEDRAMFRACFGHESGIAFEKPIDYFNRTRPGETPRQWHEEGWEDADMLHFLIQFSPFSGEPPVQEFEADGCLKWEYRKPEICPMGIDL